MPDHAAATAAAAAAADPALRKKRKQKGGNSGKNFTEGWVEFEDKAKAKEVRPRRAWLASSGGGAGLAGWQWRNALLRCRRLGPLLLPAGTCLQGPAPATPIVVQAVALLQPRQVPWLSTQPGC